MGERIVEVKDAPRIAHFQLDMALETEALELDGSLVRQAIEYIIGHPQYGYYLANRNSEGTVSIVEFLDYGELDVHLRE